MVWIRSVYPMASKLGMRMKLPSIQPRSRLAHEAVAWARSAGSFTAMHDAVFRGFFEQSADIGQVDTLMRLAQGAGLDAAQLGEALRNRTFQEQVMREEGRARDIGLSGVPAFVSGNRVLVGVQPVERLLQLIG